MLLKEEKKAITRLALLSVGWTLGLDRFYEGRTRDGFLSIFGWGLVFGTFFFLMPCQGYQYSEGVKNAIDQSVSPLIVLPLGFGVYGLVMAIRKAFRLFRQFEIAE